MAKYGAPFKMKGSPMQKNFGIVSPVKKDGAPSGNVKTFKQVVGDFREVGKDLSNKMRFIKSGGLAKKIKKDFQTLGKELGLNKKQVKKKDEEGKSEGFWSKLKNL